MFWKRVTWFGAIGLLAHWVNPSGFSAPPADVRRDAAVQAVERVLPSIVNISTESVVEIRDPLENLFRDFFGPYYRQRPPDAQKSLGSGVIIDESGYIITNYHVVRRASRISVTLVDGREFEAKAVSRTAKSDVALLKLVNHADEKFQAMRFANDDDLMLAETVLAVGNPFGLGVSVSRGILSSKTRRPPVENEPLDREDWLQTDAAINPGNSGGALINLRGELIGMNVAVFREGQGIGFAIPVKRLSEALGEIFTPEEIQDLWFGAKFHSTTGGVVISAVESGSPAEKAGLRVGDVIVKVKDQSPTTALGVNRALLASGDSHSIPIQVQRKGETQHVTVVMVPEKEVFNASLIRQKLGVTVQPLTAQQAAQMGINRSEGLMIVAVDKNSPAAQAGLSRGMIIQSIDGQAVEGILETAKALHRRKTGKTVELSVLVSRLRGNMLEIYPGKAEVTLR